VTALPTATVRPLGSADAAALRGLIDAEPYANAVIAARLDSALPPERELLGVGEPLSAACYAGGTVVPIGGDAPDWTALADHLGRRRRTCSSIVGPADAVSVLWSELSPCWGPARAVRASQPLLVLERPVPIRADRLVRPAQTYELARYLPAAAAMFDEELGIAPLGGPKWGAYITRMADLIASGRALVRTDAHGDVVFKAEVAAVSRRTAQVQGVGAPGSPRPGPGHHRDGGCDRVRVAAGSVGQPVRQRFQRAGPTPVRPARHAAGRNFVDGAVLMSW